MLTHISGLMQKLVNWLFGLDRWKKRLLQIIFDGLAVPAALLLAFFMRLETTNYFYQPDTYIAVLIATLSTLAVFAGLGLYNNLARHISMETAYTITVGSVTSCAVLLSGTLLLELEVPRSVPLIYATILCGFATTMRYFIRALGQSIAEENRKNVAIFGAGATGVQLMEALRKNPNYRVRLFIDDKRELDGKTLGGVPISNLDHAKKKFKKLEIETLLLAIPNDSNALRRRIFEILSDHPLKVKTIPSISSLISGKFKVTELEDIKIEDLLGREPVEHDPELMAKTIAERTVLVTGAGGSIGSELCRQIIFWKPKKLILLDVSEFAIYALLEELKQHPASSRIDIIPLIGSVQDRHFVKKICDSFSPETIYHTAAYKHVPLMEQNVLQCLANNVFGTLNMTEVAISAKVKHFILISTDKAVNPTNVMGASKRLAERICLAMNVEQRFTRFLIVRFGNVLGSSGSVVPLFQRQIAEGGPITLTHPDVVRYFMTIVEAVQLVIQAGALAKGGEVFVLDMGEPVKIKDLAFKMIQLSGLRPYLEGGAQMGNGDIAISIMGLRPGEKMYEELSHDKSLVGTQHPRIMSVREEAMSVRDMRALIQHLEKLITTEDINGIIRCLAKDADYTAGETGGSARQ